MAGAGFKTFTTGEVLLAADVNQYLMQQTVMVFDDATARTTALPTPSEGMFSYLKDTNLTYRYDGSAWLSDAGTTSPLTTKGDLWTYSTTDARLPVGTNGYTLVADSSETTGLKWQAPSSGSTFAGVSIYKSGNQTISNNTATALTFDSETFDTDAYHSTSTNTSRITIPSGKGGYYNIQAVVTFASNTTGYRQIALYKNNALSAYMSQSAATASGENISNASFLINLVATDYIEIYVFQTSGGNLNVTGGTNFTTVSATYLGA